MAEPALAEESTTFSELDRFEMRLNSFQAVRPRLATSSRRGISWTPPDVAQALSRSSAPRQANRQANVPSAAVGPSNMSKSDAQKIDAAFALIDKNGNGRLSRAEVIQAVRRDAGVRDLLGLPEHINQEDGSLDAVEHVFQGMDVDASKDVDLEEWRAAFRADGPLHQQLHL